MFLFCFVYPPGWADATYINSVIPDLAIRHLPILSSVCLSLDGCCSLLFVSSFQGQRERERERERWRECKVDCCLTFISFSMAEVGKKEVGNPETSSMRISPLITVWEFTWFLIKKIVTPILSPLRVSGYFLLHFGEEKEMLTNSCLFQTSEVRAKF